MAETKQPSWQFHQTDSATSSTSQPVQKQDSQVVKWTASEFIEHNKDIQWYLMLAVGGAVLAGAIYLVTGDFISVLMIIFAVIIFGVFAARKPRIMEYKIDNTGLQIGPKVYPYANFKSFATVSEGSANSIWLMPLKRFMPILSIYFAPDDEQKILEVISNYLPVQNHKPDPIDQLMHKLRF